MISKVNLDPPIVRSRFLERNDEETEKEIENQLELERLKVKIRVLSKGYYDIREELKSSATENDLLKRENEELNSKLKQVLKDHQQQKELYESRLETIKKRSKRKKRFSSSSSSSSSSSPILTNNNNNNNNNVPPSPSLPPNNFLPSIREVEKLQKEILKLKKEKRSVTKENEKLKQYLEKSEQERTVLMDDFKRIQHETFQSNQKVFELQNTIDHFEDSKHETIVSRKHKIAKLQNKIFKLHRKIETFTKEHQKMKKETEEMNKKINHYKHWNTEIEQSQRKTLEKLKSIQQKNFNLQTTLKNEFQNSEEREKLIENMRNHIYLLHQKLRMFNEPKQKIDDSLRTEKEFFKIVKSQIDTISDELKLPRRTGSIS